MTASCTSGGIDTDGSFRLGGYATQFGAGIESFVVSVGTITGDSLTGTARSRTVGNAGGAIDCYGSYVVTATRDE